MRLLRRLFRFETAEYYERFIEPKRQRAQALGISDEEFADMLAIALKEANPEIIGLAPGAILSKLIDQWEALATAPAVAAEGAE